MDTVKKPAHKIALSFRPLKNFISSRPWLSIFVFCLVYLSFYLLPELKTGFQYKLEGLIEPFYIYPPAFSEQENDWEAACSACYPLQYGQELNEEKIEKLEKLKLVMRKIYWWNPPEDYRLFPYIKNIFFKSEGFSIRVDTLNSHCKDYFVWKKNISHEFK